MKIKELKENIFINTIINIILCPPGGATLCGQSCTKPQPDLALTFSLNSTRACVTRALRALKQTWL